MQTHNLTRLGKQFVLCLLLISGLFIQNALYAGTLAPSLGQITTSLPDLDKVNINSELFSGVILDEGGNPISNATVRVSSISKETSQDQVKILTTESGTFKISVVKGERYIVSVDKVGYGLISKVYSAYNSSAFTKLKFILKKTEVFSFDPLQDNVFKDSRGTQIILPANSLVDLSGNIPQSKIYLHLYTYKLESEEMPGDMSAVSSSGQSVYLESAGAFWAEFRDISNNRYNLATGKKAIISIPAISAQPNVNLWSYDITQGTWVQESFANLTNNGYYQGEVSHFSAWNFDWEKMNPSCVKLYIPKTLFDTYHDSEGRLVLSSVVVSTSGVMRLIPLEFNSNSISEPHVLYNLPPNSIVKLYLPISSQPIISLSSGDAWGGTGIPPYSYDVCKQESQPNNDVAILNVAKVGSGYGLVRSDNNSIDCGSDCFELYSQNSNTLVRLTATGGSNGSVFTSWSGDCSNTPTDPYNVATVMVNEFSNCIAHFSTVVPLTVNLAGIGRGIVTSNPIGIDCGVSCIKDYTLYTPVILTAEPEGNSVFTGWYCEQQYGRNKVSPAVITSTDKSILVTMDQPTSCTAVFDAIEQVSQCSTFNPTSNPQLFLPCVNVDGTPYQAGMNYIPLPFSYSRYGVGFKVDLATLKLQPNLIPNEQCAAFLSGYVPSRLKVNCLNFAGDNIPHSADLESIRSNEGIVFTLTDFR